jgi:hypothetical protein
LPQIDFSYCMVRVMVFNGTFNNISSISWQSIFICGGNWSAWRKQPTCRKSLINFYHIMLHWVHHIVKGETIHCMYRNRDYFGYGSVHDTWRPLTIQTIWCSFLKKSSVELPFSSFGDHLLNILRKVNRLISAFKIN